jgi:hypothetical protein
VAAISYTISRVAEMLGENEDRLQEISIEMDPERGTQVRCRHVRRK